MKNFFRDSHYDHYLLFASSALLIIGLLMVASTSIVISKQQFTEPFHYFLHQLFYLLVDLMFACFVYRIKIPTWKKAAKGLLLASFMLLILVLVHGIGRQVNGSTRWLGFGPIGIQVSELVKLTMIIYLADYLERYQKQVCTKMSGFLRPILLLIVITAFLLREPDFGAAVIIFLTSLGTLFLAGVRVRQFMFLLAFIAVAMALLAITSPYRLARLTTFLNPWNNQFNEGYQLTQSLIAFGRGGWFGVGLGESVQKLLYLPEAHTDFLFAIMVEELGLVSGLVVMALFAIIVTCAMLIGRRCYDNKRYFSAYLAYGMGLNLALQAMINIGVNTGMLPTKGLTLPFMSYGASSLLVSCTMVALLLRISNSRDCKQALN